MWLQQVKRRLGNGLHVEWKPFSLEQVNSKNGPEWKLWEQPEDYPSRGLLALKAGEAAKRQGEEAFEAFHLALLRVRHEEKANIADMKVVTAVAERSGLDMARFEKDLSDSSILKEIGESHTQAVEKLGVFGVPTFVFPGGGTAYLKMLAAPEEKVVELFDALVNIMGRWTFVGEVKRPQPPWPKGIL